MTSADHHDAWNVACKNRRDSNLARAYIEVREALKELQELAGDYAGEWPEQAQRVEAILRAHG